jgi:putative DNA primase/helicase
MVWPDADEPGEKYAGEVAHILNRLGCDVSIVNAVALSSLAPDGSQREPEKGWDAADAVTEWQDLGALRKAAHGLAKPFNLKKTSCDFPADNRVPELDWKMSLINASDVKPEPISWLWHMWLARGKLQIIAGQPGVGKSTIAIKMGAVVSSGDPWPDGTRAKQGNVVIWSGEDDIADTLVPRLEASGADLSRIFFAGEMTCGKEHRTFDPAKDIPALQAAIRAAGGAALIIVDPIVSATAADSHKNGETRRGLQPLVDMATELDAAILGITHFTKGSEGRAPIDRVTGSVAFGALARVVMVAARQQDGDDGKPGPRILMRAKSNVGPDKGGFNYELQSVPMRDHPDIIASVISWGASVVGNAREILAEAEDVSDKDGVSKLQEAVDFLFGLLMDGPKTAKEIKKEASDFGLTWIAVRRAQTELKIKQTKQGMDGGWIWALPQDQRSSSPEDAHQNPKMLKNSCQENMSTFANLEHLRGLSEAVGDGREGEI